MGREFHIFGPVCLKVNKELVDGHFFNKIVIRI